ncbi:Sterol 26-hydroxylase, mitochondrial [Varanus komodoensis]|uniref:Cytochrome P450 family 27 subfamily A member 1 n=1 Tax=Varanus komodoensis TaxID=61221 RepID=A0A8D2IRJ9_VARKO|nr:sterol 26-hydroxylase, mitochondrial [Varanus komodoensis]KAF7241898.1 Sterol 26-hydroxylase, mitochondrial [Varanus komodoensis]
MVKLGRLTARLGRCLGSPPAASRPELARRGASGAAEAAPTSFSARERLKRPDELPGPGVLGSIYWLFLRGYLLHTHRLQVISKKLYGPIWRSQFGSYVNINIGSPEILEELLRQEGKYPMRSDMALWKEHRDKRQLPYGPFTEEGERWYRLRQVLNKRMLKPSEAVLYADAINEVVSDLIVLLENERKKSPTGVMVQDMANIFYRFALEGISYILFETRIGCLEKQIPGETQRFIDAIGFMFKNSVYATILPKWTRDVLPYWNRYLQGWDIIFGFGKKMIDKRMLELEEQLARGDEISGYLSYLLSSGRISREEVYGSIAELLMAGVDTTSNTLSWAMYHLSKNLDIQEALYQEVTNVVPKDRVPTAEDITKMPLLKAVIKETLRLYPVVPTNARIIAKDDAIVGGYKFPKNTLFVLAHYALSHDETNFPEPECFKPRRWLRNERELSPHPFSSIPFGYGVRACVGRRIAELEMHLALARLIRTFSVERDPQRTEVKALSRIVLVPDKPINLVLVDRQMDRQSFK